jgi:hypothetical protein
VSDPAQTSLDANPNPDKEDPDSALNSQKIKYSNSSILIRFLFGSLYLN